MKYLLAFFVVVFVSFFSTHHSAFSQDDLRLALDDLEKTCQDYLNSGDFEKAEKTLVQEYSKATTEREKKALAKAYGEILKLKEFAEAWTAEPTPEQKEIMDKAHDRFMDYFKGVEYTPKKKEIVIESERTETGFVTSFHFE